MVGRPCFVPLALVFRIQGNVSHTCSVGTQLFFFESTNWNTCTLFFRVSLNFGRFRVFFGLLAIALSCLACALDWHVYLYFADMIFECDDGTGEQSCYCESNKEAYERYFGNLGYVNCDNVASHNSALLLANFISSLGSLFVVTAYWVNNSCCGAATAIVRYFPTESP